MAGTEVEKLHIAVAAALRNRAPIHGLRHRAAGFSQVCTVVKPTGPDAGAKFRKVELKLVFSHCADHFHIKGCEARRISNIGVIPDIEKFHMTGGVFATAKALADLTGLDTQSGMQRVENARLAYAGISRKCADPPGENPPQLVETLAGDGAGADNGVACFFIDGV